MPRESGPTTTPDEKSDLRALRLLWLASPALPVGGFAWSRGLEAACQAGLVTGSPDLELFLRGSLEHGLGRLDLPVLARVMLLENDGNDGDGDGGDGGGDAGENDFGRRVRELDDLSLACRDTSEFLAEEAEGGKAVWRLVLELGLRPAALGDGSFVPGLTVGFGLLARGLGFGPGDVVPVVSGFASAWLQNQTQAAARLVRVGQYELQRLAARLLPVVARVSRGAAGGAGAGDDEIGSNLPMLSILSARHQDSPEKLFRS
ncbi:MAG: urease accessory protein UreF [Deltaproteobacteria bacterium]|jgi:urease accessory protein|nr:urease accessory protein UreF [Deltaproteobacteria bacterium]